MKKWTSFFFFNDTATTEIYTLSLHDALPICEVDLGKGREGLDGVGEDVERDVGADGEGGLAFADRKSTRLNSSHANISYAVFCLKKTAALTTRLRCRSPLSGSIYN